MVNAHTPDWRVKPKRKFRKLLLHKGLQGITPVYNHTGVVKQNGLPISWSYVQGNWEQAGTLGNNLH